MLSEEISVLDIFKIGVGPSSSHTLGPWRAAQLFIKEMANRGSLSKVEKLQVFLYGSLAKTGHGHGTDLAVQLGLVNEDPVTLAIDHIPGIIDQIKRDKQLLLAQQFSIAFRPEEDIIFNKMQSLPYHPNGMRFCANLSNGQMVEQTYYSIGGGFVVKQGEEYAIKPMHLQFTIDSAKDLLHYCIRTGLGIDEIVWENEQSWRSEKETAQGLMRIWEVMKESIYRGCHQQGELPGGLHVVRRAAFLNKKMLKQQTENNFTGWVEAIRSGGSSFSYILDWVSCFALAVNEENAAFSRVVTAPTNGAAGVVPAVLLYYFIFCENGTAETAILKFLLTAGQIGALFKKGSTISAAMGGCQAEIGVSSAMAAAGLTACLDGSPRQIMMAAEIAMEHHLGMTCDPVGGLVQVPCIERNAMGAVKAITASQLALQSDPDNAKVSLDAVIKTMWETARDMNEKYKETSDGGLAVNIPLGLSEC